MKVLIACEFSGRVRDEFLKLGHDAFSCDIEPTVSEYPTKEESIRRHFKTDIKNLFPDNENKFGFDLVIAHPPCTYLSNAGARWLYPKGVLNQERYENGLIAKEFFDFCLNLPVKYLCVENPKPSKIYELPPHTQKIQPYQFGEPYSKGTLLWLKNLPKLVYTKVVNIEGYWCGSFTSKHDKSKYLVAKSKKERQMTFLGIAQAMANQWGNIE